MAKKVKIKHLLIILDNHKNSIVGCMGHLAAHDQMFNEVGEVLQRMSSDITSLQNEVNGMREFIKKV